MANWLDWVLGGILAFSILGAFRNGLVREVTRLLALVFGIIGGFWFCADLAVYLQPHIDNQHVSVFAAFLAILVGSLLVGGPLGWFLSKILGWTGMAAVDRFLGATFGLVRGMLISTALVMALIMFVPTPAAPETVAASRLAPFVLNGARAAVAIAPEELRLEFSQGLERVQGLWRESSSESPQTMVQN